MAKIDHVTSAGSLAANDVVSTALADTVVEKEYLLSTRCAYTIQGFTNGDGPILFGWAHSDYSAAEIEECLEAQGNWDKSDQVAQEQARRKVRIVGSFQPNEQELINDGKPLKTKMRFALEPGKTIQLWIYNQGAVTLTTGGSIQVLGNAFLVRA